MVDKGVALGKLRETRIDQAFSQRDLAKRSKVSLGTIVRIEGGRHAYMATARKLASALGVEPRALYGEES